MLYLGRRNQRVNIADYLLQPPFGSLNQLSRHTGILTDFSDMCLSITPPELGPELGPVADLLFGPVLGPDLLFRVSI